MTKHENPALPPWADNETGPVTLRDLFAAAALAGTEMTTALNDNHNQGIDYRWVAQHSYALADAMLDARRGWDDES